MVQTKGDAQQIEQMLKERFARFEMELHPEKTRGISFGRYEEQNAERQNRRANTFDLLGFTHYCGKTRKGYFKLKRRTSRKKLGLSLKKFTVWAQKSRSRLTKGQMLRNASIRVLGHLNYYAITDNSKRCRSYVYHATQTLFKWINRKSQRSSYTWEGFLQVLNHVGWPKPIIRKDLNPCRRLQAI